MQKTALTLLTLLLVAALLAGCGLLSEPEAPSAPIEAIPLEVETETDASPAEAPAAEVEAAPETEAEAPAAAGEATTAGEAAAATSAPTIFTIVPEQSQVRFELDEDLRGQRITVVGTTNQLAGQLAVNPADLADTQVGIIQINARALVTDNNFRNRAIQNEILQTGAHEFITFTPTSVDGLPGAAAVGDEINFTVSGDLTVRDVTQPVTFDVTAVLASENQITGTASTSIQRADFNLVIPQVRQVANVEEVVELYIDFVALAG